MVSWAAGLAVAVVVAGLMAVGPFAGAVVVQSLEQTVTVELVALVV